MQFHLVLCCIFVVVRPSFLSMYVNFHFPLFQGAPETHQEMLIDLPSSYVQTYKKYTRQGSRVLALAYKFLPEMTVRIVPFSFFLPAIIGSFL